MTDLIRADDDKSEKAKEIEAALKADAGAAEKASKESMAKLLDAVTGLATKFDAVCGRLDTLEAAGKKKGDDDDDDFSNGKMPGDPKEMKVDADEPDENEMAAAQSKADSVWNMHGKAAPKPLHGETLLAYRRRLLQPFLAMSDSFKDVDLKVLSVDKAAFDGVEAKVYADAIEAAKNPRVPEGQLMERTRTVNGHTYHEFYGSPSAWMDGYSSMGQAVTGFGKSR
jgi:hypothetical protein